jgi:hypothetical protein
MTEQTTRTVHNAAQLDREAEVEATRERQAELRAEHERIEERYGDQIAHARDELNQANAAHDAARKRRNAADDRLRKLQAAREEARSRASSR